MSENKEFLPAPRNMTEALEQAKILATSGLVPKTFENKPNAVIVAMMWSHNLGIPVVQGLQYIAVVNGRPTMYGDGLLAVVMASGKCEDIQETIEGDGNKAVAICRLKRKGFTSPTIRTFSMVEAINAGLAGKVGPWKQYPRRMLQLRARAFALRDAFPDVLSGMAVYEEERDVIEAEMDEQFAAEDTAKAKAEAVKPAPKRPRRKAPAKVEEAAEAVTDVQPVEAAEAVEAVEEQAAPVEPAHDEIEAVAERLNDSAEIINRIMACTLYDEMLVLWGTLSEEAKKDPAIRQAFADHGKEVKKEA